MWLLQWSMSCVASQGLWHCLQRVRNIFVVSVAIIELSDLLRTFFHLKLLLFISVCSSNKWWQQKQAITQHWHTTDLWATVYLGETQDTTKQKKKVKNEFCLDLFLVFCLFNRWELTLFVCFDHFRTVCLCDTRFGHNKLSCTTTPFSKQIRDVTVNN